MASGNKHHSFVENLAEKVYNLGSDTLKFLFTNTAPVASNTVKANLTEISAGNGYAAGGPSVTITASSQTSGTYKLVGNDVVTTASGGTIGPFRYVDLYDDTATNDELIAWWDYGSSITLQNGESFTIDLDQTGGILTIA